MYFLCFSVSYCLVLPSFFHLLLFPFLRSLPPFLSSVLFLLCFSGRDWGGVCFCFPFASRPPGPRQSLPPRCGAPAGQSQQRRRWMRATGPLTDSSARRDALLGHYHAAQGTAAGASPHPELAPCRPAQRQPRPNEKDGNGEVRRDPLDQRPLCLARATASRSVHRPGPHRAVLMLWRGFWEWGLGWFRLLCVRDLDRLVRGLTQRSRGWCVP